MPQYSPTVIETQLEGISVWRRGKVRDVYELGDELLIVATDRISAFDVVLPTPIPGKGAVLNGITRFWFELLHDVTPNHMIATDVADFPAVLQPFADVLEGRSMLVKRTDPLPVECVVRGYLAGSGWNDYQKTGAVCGVKLPAGLRESDRLPEPIFTPSTKATSGHDENISIDEVARLVGPEVAARLRDLSLQIYERGRAHAESRGIILADTKFEFGTKDGKLVWIDEALTPDSSRFWPEDTYRPGGAQPSFDKQYVRDYLQAIKWSKTPPAPPLPEDVVERTREKYAEALTRLTGAATVPSRTR